MYQVSQNAYSGQDGDNNGNGSAPKGKDEGVVEGEYTVD